MVDLSGFDANKIDPTAGLGPIPAGEYLTVITDSEIKPTKSIGGHCLELTFRVVNGPYANHPLWSQLDLDSSRERTRLTAQAELSAICRAVGVLQLRESTELHNVPLLVTVTCEKRWGTGEMVNVIRGYTKRETTKVAKS